MPDLQISNIKVSIKTKVHKPSLLNFKSQNVQKCKDVGSFFVYRQKGFVFSIYYTGHVNVTGIRCMSKLEDGISILKSIPGIQSIKNIILDNITCTGLLPNSMYSCQNGFTEYLNALSALDNFDIIQYSPQTFPGAFLKKTGLGTIVFFSTGKFNLVGCKSYDILAQLITIFMNSILKLQQ